eukprot:1195505-Prorocentrum_minimum.AAC.5
MHATTAYSSVLTESAAYPRQAASVQALPCRTSTSCWSTYASASAAAASPPGGASCPHRGCRCCGRSYWPCCSSRPASSANRTSPSRCAAASSPCYRSAELDIPLFFRFVFRFSISFSPAAVLEGFSGGRLDAGSVPLSGAALWERNLRKLVMLTCRARTGGPARHAGGPRGGVLGVGHHPVRDGGLPKGGVFHCRSRRERRGRLPQRLPQRQPSACGGQRVPTHDTAFAIIVLHFTGPPVPITARVHSTPQRPFPFSHRLVQFSTFFHRLYAIP